MHLCTTLFASSHFSAIPSITEISALKKNLFLSMPDVFELINPLNWYPRMEIVCPLNHLFISYTRDRRKLKGQCV